MVIINGIDTMIPVNGIIYLHKKNKTFVVGTESGLEFYFAVKSKEGVLFLDIKKHTTGIAIKH